MTNGSSSYVELSVGAYRLRWLINVGYNRAFLTWLNYLRS
jgi:hypothetical protein